MIVTLPADPPITPISISHQFIPSASASASESTSSPATITTSSPTTTTTSISTPSSTNKPKPTLPALPLSLHHQILQQIFTTDLHQNTNTTLSILHTCCAFRSIAVNIGFRGHLDDVEFWARWSEVFGCFYVVDEREWRAAPGGGEVEEEEEEEDVWVDMGGGSLELE